MTDRLLPEVLYRVDAVAEIGMGHLYRCLALAEEAAAAGCRVMGMAGRLSEPATALIRQRGYAVWIMPERLGWEDEPGWLRERVNGTPGAIVLDIAHPVATAACDGFDRYQAKLRQWCPVTVLIDGYPGHALLGRVSIDASLLVIPYVGAEALVKAADAPRSRCLLGPAYYLLSPAYRDCQPRTTVRAADADRVLITCGGSDPHGLTNQILKALVTHSTERLHLRIIVGPGFAPTRVEEIRRLATACHHLVELVDAPGCLGEHMIWSDLAVSASGLTKYELAYTGTPAICLSIDAAHDAIHATFAAAGTGIDLGLASQASPAAIARAVSTLLADGAARQAMADRGRALVDGAGARRLVDAMCDACSSTVLMGTPSTK